MSIQKSWINYINWECNLCWLLSQGEAKCWCFRPDRRYLCSLLKKDVVGCFLIHLATSSDFYSRWRNNDEEAARGECHGSPDRQTCSLHIHRCPVDRCSGNCVLWPHGRHHLVIAVQSKAFTVVPTLGFLFVKTFGNSYCSSDNNVLMKCRTASNVLCSICPRR